MPPSLGSSFRGTLQRVSKVLSAVAHLRGPADKIRFLTQDPDARSIVPLLRFTTDPNVTFGITRKVAENALKSPTAVPSNGSSSSSEPTSVQALLQEMNEGKWSRPSLRDPMLGHLATKHKLDAEDIETLVRLLDRNLKVGLGPARWRELPLTIDQQKKLDAMLSKSTQTPTAAHSPSTAPKPSSSVPNSTSVPTVAASTSSSLSTALRLTTFPGTALGYPFKGKLDPAVYFASRKLDGVRMIATVTLDSSTQAVKPTVECYSRTGKPLSVPDVVVSDLARLFSSINPSVSDNGLSTWVLDGELCVAGSKPGASDDFDRVISTVRSTRNTANAFSTDIHYYIFDALTLAEFMSKSSSRILSDRLSTLISRACASSPTISITVAELGPHSWSTPIPNTSHLHLMTHQRIHGATDVTHVADLMHLARSQGWEGLIVRKDAPYRGARHKDVLKVKHFADAEFTVVGVDIDPAFRIPRPMLPPVLGPDLAPYVPMAAHHASESVVTAPYAKAVWVDVSGGQRVAVGSGMSLVQRLEWARYPERIVGRQVTVQYFEQTKDGSLRFPSLKAVYGPEGRDV
ncbi:hypothetical protein BCR44DRAFT_245243 [Catenaria anguillulae PL171]|uniref:ATP-dependent DNA ligase family profile domain-containing protein n=1 Tax=Catenaria anguillulae PL171 TaxID=765915 RepID=A0A1Y2HSQ0_9FUNG|nr:hypothetical protein BCR44DRAFT_245243 [Catenaria anguillulae PL171]